MKKDVTAREWILTELAGRAEDLKSAVEELNGEREPDKPAELVKRIRTARAEIRRLLDEADTHGMQDPIVKRLRAAHPLRSAV